MLVGDTKWILQISLHIFTVSTLSQINLLIIILGKTVNLSAQEQFFVVILSRRGC